MVIDTLCGEEFDFDGEMGAVYFARSSNVLCQSVYDGK